MTSTIYTVVAWQSGDQIVHPVGPTATDRSMLRPVLDSARERYGAGRAEIVPWSQRSARPSVVAAVAEEKRSAASADDYIDALDQQEARAEWDADQDRE